MLNLITYLIATGQKGYNMVLPNTVTERIVKLLDDKKGNIIPGTKVQVKEISEDTKQMSQPYIGVYSDFDEEADLNSAGESVVIPVGVYLVCCASQCGQASQSYAQAIIMAVEALKIVRGAHTLKNTDGGDELVYLKAQKLPLLVQEKSAKRSAVIVQLSYVLTEV